MVQVYGKILKKLQALELYLINQKDWQIENYVVLKASNLIYTTQFIHSSSDSYPGFIFDCKKVQLLPSKVLVFKN